MRAWETSISDSDDTFPSLDDAAALLDVVTVEHANNVAIVEGEERATWLALAVPILPSLDDEVLKRTGRMLGMAHISPSRVRQQLARERQIAHDDIAAFKALPEARDIEPAVAGLEARRAELSGHVQSLLTSVRGLRADADFRELIETGFNTSADAVRWWMPSARRRRRSAARLLAAHGHRPHVVTFSKLVSRYRDESSAIVTLETELRDLVARLHKLRIAWEKHELATRRLASLEDSTLAQARSALVDGLRALDEEALFETLAADSGLVEWGPRLSGVRAKGRYLSAIHHHWIERLRLDLRGLVRDRESILDDVAAYGAAPPLNRARPSLSGLEARVQGAVADATTRVSLYRQTAAHLIAFERYASVDPLRGDLWWDSMGHPGIDGSFIDEVAWHRTRRPTVPSVPLLDSSGRRAAWEKAAQNAADRLDDALKDTSTE